MNKAAVALRLFLLCTAAVLVLGTGSFPEPENPRRTDETWMVVNVWDGQTSVDPGITIELALGQQDFRLSSQAEDVISDVVLRRTDTGSAVPVRLTIGWASTHVVPVNGLQPDTDYELDLTPLEGQLYSTRGFPPRPVRFSTRDTPRVVGLYRVEDLNTATDTLVVLFSQPMYAATLYVSQQSVDLIWQDGGLLRSLAADQNLAAYAWDTAEHLFLLAPFEARPSMWLKISSSVKGVNGVRLDGDGDGIGGTAWDDHVEEISWPVQIPVCFSRSDIPQPCIASEHIPDFQQTW